MLQHADPDLSPAQDEGQDSLRHEVEQIIAQRLERRNLMKSKPDAAAQEMPVAAAPSLRRKPFPTPEHPPAPARAPVPEPAPEPMSDFDEEIRRALEPRTSVKPEVEAATATATATATAMPVNDLAAFEDDVAEEAVEEFPSTFEPIDDLPGLDQPEQPVERRRHDRREADRRNMEFLRTEVAWSSSDEDDEKKSLFSGGLKRSRLILIALAVISAAVAAVLALSGSPAPAPTPKPAKPVVEKVVEAPMTRILVATSTIGAGEPLSADSIGWHEVPVSTLLPAYISAEANPDAIKTYDQSIARYPFLPGDPIRTDKLLTSPQSSLSDSLSSGMRGVSVVVTADAAAGGFIKPDDHVDVILVSSGKGQTLTRTVLSDVRVIAINAQLGPQTTGEVTTDPANDSKVFKGTALATLELDPADAEVLVRAASEGRLTLTLRPPNANASTTSQPRNGLNQTIRLTSPFWNDTKSTGVQ